jgi:signal transduction histidine kinase
VMVLIPWLSASLAERWSANNRQSIERAENKQAHALAEANAYRDRAHAMYEVAYALSTNPNDQSILDTTLAEGRKLMEYSCGAVLLATGNLDELFVAASFDLGASEKQQTITLGHGEISNSIREGLPFVIENLQLEPVFAPLPTLMQNRAACAIPLRSGKQNFGIMVVAAGSSAVFTDDRVEMLSALANYSLIALQNAHLINDLRNERTKLLSKEEEVRHQLARDLHDGPAQSLAAITMNVEFIKRMFERDPGRVIAELDKLSTLAKRTTHEVRTMLFELRPLALETQGLGETLRQYFERFQDSAGNTQILLETGTLDVSLDTKTEGTLFNIIQEGVNNALKHARAQHIWVRVHHIGDQVETVIQDDGRGFDIQKVKATYDKRGSFGLLNIEERAQLVGGTAELHSTPGQGTTVRVVVPVR